MPECGSPRYSGLLTLDVSSAQVVIPPRSVAGWSLILQSPNSREWDGIRESPIRIEGTGSLGHQTMWIW